MARFFVSSSSQRLITDFEISYPFSMGCFWAHYDDLAHGVMGVGDTGGPTHDSLFVRWDGALPGRTICAESYNVTTGRAYANKARTLYAWHHGLGVFASSSDRRIYMDFGNKETNDVAVSVTINGLAIGGTADSTPAAFNGGVAFPAVWAREFSDDDVKLLQYLPPWRVYPESLVFCSLLRPRDRDRDIIGNRQLVEVNAPTWMADPLAASMHWLEHDRRLLGKLGAEEAEPTRILRAYLTRPVQIPVHQLQL